MNLFTWVDYSVVAATLIFSTLIGVYYAVAAKNATNEDLLVGGRSMGALPIACSMLVTYLSAITILGYPAEVYGYGIQIFQTTIVFVIMVPPAIYFFMAVFYKMKLTSIYEYLEYCFDSIVLRRFAAFIFLLQMSVFMGVCLFAPSIALSAFMGFELWQSVVGLGLCATIYTSMGGIKAVVWTDVFQLIMMLGGMIAILYKGFYSSGGFVRAFKVAHEHGRLELMNFTVDFFMRHNTLNIFLGQGFAVFSLFATHQPQVQRYCSLPSLKHAIKATLISVPLNIMTVSFCLIAGVAIFATYAGCDPMALGDIKRVDSIVPYFVSKELKFPGMLGLFTACVFSASLSTLSSGLNSLAAVVFEEFLKTNNTIQKMSPQGQGHLVRGLAVAFGVLSIALAFAAQNMGSVLSACLTATGAMSGLLGAVFAMGLLMPYINRNGAITDMTVGFVSMLWITINAFILGKSHPHIPFSSEECPVSTFEGNSTMQARVLYGTEGAEIHWPQKLYTVSYILYPFLGGVITFIFSTIASLITGGWSQRKNIDDKYLHPLLRSKSTLKHKASIIRSDEFSKDRYQISTSTPIHGIKMDEIDPFLKPQGNKSTNTKGSLSNLSPE